MITDNFFRIFSVSLIIVLSQDVFGVEITKLTVPKMIESGKKSPVDLDCQYRCNETDQPVLIVKWFFNDEPEPFFTWIGRSDQDPDVSDKFLRNLEMDKKKHMESCNRHTWHLRLLQPGVQMSGKYRCEVSTLYGGDSAEATMIVYSAPQSFSFNLTEEDDRKLLVCDIGDVYPVPDVKLYRIISPLANMTELDNVQVATSKNKKTGLYQVTVTSEIQDNKLPQYEESVFQCDVSMKDVKSLRLFERLTYVPGNGNQPDDPANSSAIRLPNHLLVLPLLLVLLLLR